MIDPLDPNNPDAGLAPGSTSLTLLDRLRRRDPEGWRRYVRLYGPLIYRWCRRGRLRPEDAADVTQEVFRAVAARIDDFRRDRPGDSFRGWLWTITRHKIGDHLRRLRRQPDAAGGSDAQERWQLLPDPLPDDDDAAADFSDLVHRAMELVRGVRRSDLAGLLAGYRRRTRDEGRGRGTGRHSRRRAHGQISRPAAAPGGTAGPERRRAAWRIVVRRFPTDALSRIVSERRVLPEETVFCYAPAMFQVEGRRGAVRRGGTILMTPATCPTTEVLSAYVLGKLPDEALRALAAHAADCPSCQSELQRRDETIDGLILQIRRPPRTDALNDEPHLSKALRQAQSLTTAPGRESAAHPWLAPAQRPTSWAASAPTASSV